MNGNGAYTFRNIRDLDVLLDDNFARLADHDPGRPIRLIETDSLHERKILARAAKQCTARQAGTEADDGRRDKTADEPAAEVQR